MKPSIIRRRNQQCPKHQLNDTHVMGGNRLMRVPGRSYDMRRGLNNVISTVIAALKSNASPAIFGIFISMLLCSQYNCWLNYKINSIIGTGDVSPNSISMQWNSLLLPYSMDYDKLRELRSANIQKWKMHHVRTGYQYNETGIDRRSYLSIQEFSDIYDGKWPVLLTDVVTKWPAYNWTGDFFNQYYGEERVAMKAVDLNLDAAISQLFPELHQMSLSGDVADQRLSQAISMAMPLHKFYENADKAHPKAWTYIEDELFIPMRPELRRDIGDTIYLEEDFFQLFPDDVRPWNAMLLWGTKYSRSSLHMDPYNWTGTNAVIRGRKLWKLYPPGQDDYLYIERNQKSGFPLECFKYNSVVDAFDPDLKKYPLFKKAFSILFEQLPGEMLFIPSGWFHQAYNGDETLAISSQVMNRNNYRIILEEIIKAGNIPRKNLPQEIDLKSPRQQVETIMSLLPQRLLRRGREVTQDVLNQMKPTNMQDMDGYGHS